MVDYGERLRAKVSETGPEASIGLFDATTLGVGALMGAGLYVLVGVAAAEAGPSLWLAYLLCGLLTCLSMVMYGDLAMRLPVTGGGYAYAYRTLGSFWGFLVGWTLAVGSVFACALYAVGFAAYFGAFLPEAWREAIGLRLLACGIVLGLTALAMRGGSGGMRLQRWMTWGNVGVLAVLSVAAFIQLDTGNFSPALPHGFGGIGGAISLIYLSFFGYQLIANNAEEIEHAPRNVPRAMGYAMLVALVAYVIVALAAVAAVPWSELASSDAPLVLVAERALGGFGIVLVGVGGVLASLGALNGTLAAQGRQLFAMGRDRLLPAGLGELTREANVPRAGLLAGAAATLFAVALGSTEFLAHAANFALIFSMMPLSVSLHLLYADRTEGDAEIPLWRRAVPWAAFAANGALLATLDFDALNFGGTMIAAGCIVFFTYSYTAERRGQAGWSVVLAEERGASLPLLQRSERVLATVSHPDNQELIFSIAHGLLPQRSGEVVTLNVVKTEAGQRHRDALKVEAAATRAVATMQQLEGVAANLGVRIRPVVRAAHDLPSGIVDTLVEEGCRVVVMGWSRGDDGQASAIVDGVVRRARAHVLLVARRGEKAPRRIGVSIAGPKNLALMSQVATSLAAQGGGEVTYMSVVPRHFTPEQLQQARAAQIEVLSRHERLVPFRAELVCADNPYDAIRERSRGLDLLVVGTGWATAAASATLSPFATLLAENAHCSVVVVKTAPMIDRILPSQLVPLQELTELTLGAGGIRIR